jgi:histidine triad (HIT) family protein
MVTEEELKNMSPEEIKKLQEQNCIFCKIGKKEVPSKVLYEDDIVIAFLDIQPLAFGHTVVTTKKHYVFFSQIPDDEIGHMFKVAQQISQSMLKALQSQGTNMFIANGPVAGQQAPHFMLHIVPRAEHSDIPQFHPAKITYNKPDLDKIQEALLNRISDVFKVDMKARIAQKKPEQEKQEPTQEVVVEKTKPLQKEPEKKETPIDDHKDDVDLDKISNLFK